MLFYATPSYSEYPIASPAVYPAAQYGPYRTPSARERYLRAVANAQAARQTYLRELEEEQLLESLRQQEALRQADIRHRQAAIRQEQAQFLAARRAFHYPRTQPISQPEFAVPAGDDQQQLRTVRDLLVALVGDDGVDDAEIRREQQRREDGRAAQIQQAVQESRDRFLRHLDTIRQEAQNSPRPHFISQAQAARPQPTQPKACGAPQTSCNLECRIPTVPQFRRAEFLRTRHRAASTIQEQWRSHSADAAARKDALLTIETLRARFHFLHKTFTFPEHIEFKGQGADREMPTLSFSPLNASVHAYTNELTKLLMQADGVSSGGSRHVRDVRRAFVQDVEEQLKEVEDRVAKIWGKRAEVSGMEKPKSPAATATEDAPAPVPASEFVSVPEAVDNSVDSESNLGISQVTILPPDDSRPHEEDSNSYGTPVVVAQQENSSLVSLRAETFTSVDAVPRTPSRETTEINLSGHVDSDKLGSNELNMAPSESTPLSSPVEETGRLEGEAHRSILSTPTPQSTEDYEVNIPNPSGPAATPPEVREPFDIVYPDSRSATPASFDSDDSKSEHSVNNGAKEASNAGRRGGEEEGFELL